MSFYNQLRDEALGQLNAARDRLGLAPVPPPRPPEEIAPELALVEAALKQAPCWAEAAAINPTSADDLRQYLAMRAGDLKTELAGRPVEVGSPSELDLLDFALEALPVWAEEVHLLTAEVATLRDHLGERRAALLGIIARELALLGAALEQVRSWVEAAALSSTSAIDLRQHLTKRAGGLKAELARRPVEVEPPLDLDLIDFVFEALPRWAEDAPLLSADITSLRAHLGKQQAALLRPNARELALVEATLGQVRIWAKLAVINPVSADALGQYLTRQAGVLKAMAGRPVEVEPPSDLDALDFALESLPSWAKALDLHFARVASLRDHLNRRRSALMQPHCYKQHAPSLHLRAGLAA